VRQNLRNAQLPAFDGLDACPYRRGDFFSRCIGKTNVDNAPIWHTPRLVRSARKQQVEKIVFPRFTLYRSGSCLRRPCTVPECRLEGGNADRSLEFARRIYRKASCRNNQSCGDMRLVRGTQRKTLENRPLVTDLTQCLARELHQPIDFLLWSLVVLDRESVESDARYPQM
jgi:hypothetical protein